MKKDESTAQIITIAGGKGGVGKSVFAANLSAQIALLGKKTVLVDLDLGGSNLHTMFGISVPDKGVADYIYKKSSKELADYAVSTEVENLKLVPCESVPGMANLEYWRKMKILRALSRLDADCVVVDLGAGSSFNTVDLFSMTKSGIVVTVPETTAIISAYEFVKNVVYRTIANEFKKSPELKQCLAEVKNSNVDGGSLSTLADVLMETNPEAGLALTGICQKFKLSMVLNMARKRSMELGSKLQDICKNYLNIELALLGTVSDSALVRRSIIDENPISLAYPDEDTSVDIRAIAERCIKSKLTISVPQDEAPEEAQDEAPDEREVEVVSQL